MLLCVPFFRVPFPRSVPDRLLACAVYKTTKTIVQTLVSVVATGGSLLLDVGPMPTGELPPTALQRMAETGEWMAANSEAIYDTTPQSPYAINATGPAPAGVRGDFSLDWRLTRKADAVYATLLLDNSTLPAGMAHLALPVRTTYLPLRPKQPTIDL